MRHYYTFSFFSIVLQAVPLQYYIILQFRNAHISTFLYFIGLSNVFWNMWEIYINYYLLDIQDITTLGTVICLRGILHQTNTTDGSWQLRCVDYTRNSLGSMNKMINKISFVPVVNVKQACIENLLAYSWLTM